MPLSKNDKVSGMGLGKNEVLTSNFCKIRGPENPSNSRFRFIGKNEGDVTGGNFPSSAFFRSS